MNLSDLVSPVSPADRNAGSLGEDDGPPDGSGHLLGGLDAEADMTVEVTDAHERLEAGALSGPGLLLDRHDLHDFVLQGTSQKVVDNLVLLDRHGEQVDLLQRLDLSSLHEASQAGRRDPGTLSVVATAPSASAATATASAESASEASALSARGSLLLLRVSHSIQNMPFLKREQGERGDT